MPTFEYTLYFGRNHPPLELYAMQGEAGSQTFKLHLVYQNGVKAPGNGSTAYAYVSKNDGTVVVMDCTVETGSVTFTLPLQACTCPGKNRMYIQVLSGQEESRWDNILLFVEPCDIEDAVASTDDLGPLANIITDPDYLQTIANAYENATDALEDLMGDFKPVGDWKANTAYKTLNIVSHEGYSYAANQPSTGVEPPNATYWTLIGSKGDQGTQGPPGAQGEPGTPGQAATIQIGEVTTGEPGTSASVENTGTESAAVLKFTIPRGETGAQGIQGPPGPQGNPGTGLDILGTYDTLEALKAAVTQPKQGQMYNVGTSDPYTVYMWDTTNGGQWLSQGQLQGAKGDTGEAGPPGDPGQAATVQVGQVVTGDPGTQASVSNSGTTSAAVLDFTIPRGEQGAQGEVGATPDLSIGTVDTLEPSQPATATITGTAEAPVLNLGIPKGQQGDPGTSGITSEQVQGMINDAITTMIFPVGSVYVTMSNVNPGTYIAGTTWEEIGQGRTLMGVDAGADVAPQAGWIGGDDHATIDHVHEVVDHVLSIDEIPNHRHDMAHEHSMNHTHSHTLSNENAGPSGSFRVLSYPNGEATGNFSVNTNTYDQEWPGGGSAWGARTYHLGGSHTHTITGGISQFTGNTGPYDYYTGYIGGGNGHNHGNTTQAGGTIEIVPKYIATYFWKRTA